MEPKKNEKPPIKWAGPLKGDQFYNVTETKNNIFLHHTAGDSARGAIDWWNQTPEHVGTPFVIERDGTIFQCFDETKWAYSLGVKGSYETEKHGIPIEIVSWGFLQKEADGKFYAYPNWPLTKKKVLIKDDDVYEVDFKGFHYWQKYTDAQIESLIKLVKWLVQEYKIPVQNDLHGFLDYNVEVATKNIPGIWSHTTVRKDKFDLFPQENLLKALYETYPKGTVTLGKDEAPKETTKKS